MRTQAEANREATRLRDVVMAKLRPLVRHLCGRRPGKLTDADLDHIDRRIRELVRDLTGGQFEPIPMPRDAAAYVGMFMFTLVPVRAANDP